MANESDLLVNNYRSLLRRSRDRFDADTVWPDASPVRLDCTICYEATELSETAELSACSHVFCAGCLRQHCLAAQRDGATTITCPAVGCGASLTQAELRRLLDENAFGVLDRRSLEQAVADDPTLHLCRTPDCSFVYFWTGPDDSAKELPRLDCPLCGVQRCLLCGQVYHLGTPCGQPQAQPIAAAEAVDPDEDDQTRIAREEAATAAFLASDEAGVRICPRCKNGITKSDGCFKMKCRCGFRMCYNCGSENAQCPCTPAGHGFIDNLTGWGDFNDLYQVTSPT